MTITATIELPNFDSQFTAGIMKEIKTQFAKKMPSILKNIKQKLEIALSTAIKDSFEYQALFGGELQGQLGLPNPMVIDSIIEQWANGIEVNYKPNTSFGVISIGMIQADYADVLTMPEASFVYATTSGNGVIEWLRWLLLESTSIIVLDYDFVASNRGRTGLGVMVSKDGGGWRVPQQYAGTATDNFATRALVDIEKSIDTIVRQEITKGF